MTREILHTQRFTCDGCGIVTILEREELPAGWSRDHEPAMPGIFRVRHYCPRCREKHPAREVR